VVDIPGRRVHVYREPSSNGYAMARAFGPTDVVSPRDLPAIQLTVGTLFT
jgi:hypothetical protein